MDWRDAFAAALRAGDWDRAAELLHGADRLPAAVRILEAALRDGAPGSRYPDLRAAIRALLNSSHALARRLGAWALVRNVQSDDPALDVHNAVRGMAIDPDRTVRAWAAAYWAGTLALDFDGTYRTLSAWSLDRDWRLRVCVLGAIRRAARRSRPMWSSPLTLLAQQMMGDSHPAVQAACGRPVIGGALLRAYPDLVLSKLPLWADEERASVRRNVADACGRHDHVGQEKIDQRRSNRELEGGLAENTVQIRPWSGTFRPHSH